MTAISKQKHKLTEMTDYFCQKMSQVLVTLFDNVLKHKCLHKESKSSFSGIDVKQFNFFVVIDHGLKFSARLLNATEQEKGSLMMMIIMMMLIVMLMMTVMMTMTDTKILSMMILMTMTAMMSMMAVVIGDDRVNDCGDDCDYDLIVIMMIISLSVCCLSVCVFVCVSIHLFICLCMIRY